jgi:hypothetical protein
MRSICNTLQIFKFFNEYNVSIWHFFAVISVPLRGMKNTGRAANERAPS